MRRYEVAFSPKALDSLRRITRHIARDGGPRRASGWPGKIMDSVVTLETHPRAFPAVGRLEAEEIRSRVVMKHLLYYFVDERNHTVTVIDVVHTARQSERRRYERE